MGVQLNSYETIAFARQAIATEPRARFNYRGGNGVVVLSKYPVGTPEMWVLPSTQWRTIVVRAPITLPDGPPLDVYCTALTAPLTDCALRPYTGDYGNGQTCEKGWAEENLLQSKKLVDYLSKHAGATKRRSVILSELYAGRGYDDGTNDVITAQYLPSYDTVRNALGLGVPLGYTPRCTRCADNPIVTAPGATPTGISSWTSQILLSQIAVPSVKATSIILDEAVVDYDAGYGKPIPLSTFYGIRSVVRLEKP
jgi:hypothetical protein